MRGLYKAKSKKTGEWVEGSLLVLDWESDYVYIMKEFPRASTLPASVIIADNMVLVDKKTICQYIELKDENGKKIWENDIIETPFWRFCVTYTDGVYGDSEGTAMRESIFGEGGIVVGNIFDNPELMEGMVK